MTHLPLHSSKETHLLMEFALKHGQKKHKGPNDWIASVAVRVLHFDPKAINQHPIIRRNQRIRSKAGRSRKTLNQKFLRSLPPSWSQIALIMRNKPDIDEVDIDDLYNNLRVYEDELKRNRKKYDISKKNDPFSLDKSKIECYNCIEKDIFAIECRSRRSPRRRPNGDKWQRAIPTTTESSSQALVAQDGLGGYDWSNDFEVEPVDYDLMAISSSSSSISFDSEVQKCSKCIESFKCLQKNYDTKREKHNKAKLEIRGYEIALELLEARILRHEKNEISLG
ncbi:hypothetical protein Tco_0629470 [Tanacetum coccineum]|uniref:Uncharacterized protein n=1 Tax=Tanacetum coccineum TaxID=301880 RepID=A0ABQ4WTG8_9ASTR